jgi:predicted anti-sigma-YlaC factor YlaD
MICEWVKDHLLDYLDRELGSSEGLVIKEHLNDCDRCRREYEVILNAWKALDLWEDLMPPGHLEKNILRNIDPRRKTQWSYSIVSAAAVLLIIIGGAFFYRGTDSKNYQELAADNKSTAVQLHTDISEENENDIIANLQLLREKEFYDSMDKLEKIDYLPLVEAPGQEVEKDQRSSLELLAV